MKNLPYEILFRGNSDGTLSGGHVIDAPGNDARPIGPDDLAELAPAINAALFGQVEALTAERDELATLRATMEASVGDILQMDKPEDKFVAMEQLGRSFITPARQKAAQALAQEIAAKQAELDALTAEN